MNCNKHTDKSAVNVCKACGVGICSTCYEATKNYETLCLSCAQKEASQDISFGKTLKKKLIAGSVVLSIVWAIGISLFISGFAVTDGIYLIVIGMLICGLPTAVVFWKKGTEAHLEDEMKHGANYTVTDSGVYKDQGWGYKLGYAAIGLVLGLLANPVKVIKNIVQIGEINKEIPALEAMIKRWSAM